MSQLSIYKASAGSGKTHTLTQEYLKLSFENPNAFAHILAVTFTNKAAGEMKERILLELDSIAHKGEKNAHYSVINQKYTDKSEAEIKKLSAQILTNLLHNYSAFSVSTIDSFTQRVLRAFSFELGVQSGYKIEMDEAKVLTEITEMLYKRIDTDKQLRNWLLRFANFKIEQGKSWDFRDDIIELASEIFKEKFRFFSAAGLSTNDNREILADLLKDVIKIKDSFQKQMQALSERAENEINKKGIDSNQLGAKFKTIANYLTTKISLSAKDSDYEPTVRIYEALESIENWYAKTAKKNVVLDIENVYPVLFDCVDKAVNLYNSEFRSYLSAKTVMTNFHAFGILSDIASLLPEYREANNLMLISDTTAMLKDIIDGNDAPFIYEKVGSRYQNILIDEFQDTSGFQWDNFRPLIQNSLSNGLFNLIVGDIKQSIYRWRSGDWKLLLYGVERQIGAELIEEKNLDTNWRSRKNILDFNNALFFSAPQLIQHSLNAELQELNSVDVKQKLIDAGYQNIVIDSYSDSYQHIPSHKNKAGGRVTVKFFRVENRLQTKKKWREEMPNYLPQLIEDLIINKNYSPRDITILVRKNKEGNELVEMLTEHQLMVPVAYRYDIISSESLYIEQSPAVQLIVAALLFLMDNTDNITLTSLVHNYLYLNKSKRKEAFEHEVFSISGNKQQLIQFLPQRFVNEIDTLLKLQLYELVNELIFIFQLNEIENEQAYLRTFCDAVLSYIQDNTSGLYGFIDWWKVEGGKLSLQLSDKQDAVKILTIHKSKGLAFKVVIVPFCDWTLDHSSLLTSPIIWCDTHSEPYNKYPVLPVKYKGELAKTVFQHDYFDEKVQTSIDSLNLMYVALTRAVEELHIMAPTDENDEHFSQVSDLLYQSIANEVLGSYPENNEMKFESLRQNYNHQSAYYDNSIGYEKNSNEYLWSNKNLIEIHSLKHNNWRNKLSMVHHSSDFFIQSVDFIADKVNYGTIMHSIFAQITTPADVDRALQSIYFSGKITSKQKSKIRQTVYSIINRPEVNDWFSNKWFVKNETALLTSEGNLRIPDRVLLSENQTVVVDFKFGKQNEEHHHQVREYMTLIRQMNYPNVVGYLYYAEENAKVEVKF